MNVINPAGWPRPRGYSNATSARGQQIFVAGQIGWNPLTEQVETDDLVEQFERAIFNVATVLREAGAGPEHVTRLVWYLTSWQEYMDARSEIGSAYRKAMGNHYPAMSVVIVAGLIEPRAKVEIEATAVIPDDSESEKR